MSAEQVRTDYDELLGVQQRWEAQAEATRAMISSLTGRMDQLKGGDWYGEAATKFYEEMDGIVMPALARLREALEEAGVVTGQIVEAIRAAEEECMRLLSGAAS